MNENIRVGFAVTGSFCTLKKAMAALTAIKEAGYDVTPLMSEHAVSTDTRFGKAEDFRREMEAICGKPVIDCIAAAEPVGPKKLFDILVILPCTGNSAAKIANGISDTSVTLAAKSHMRNQRPVLIGISSNDALSGNAKSLGMLLNTKNVFLIPFTQDAPDSKPRSAVADFGKVLPALAAALEGKQLQPILF